MQDWQAMDVILSEEPCIEDNVQLDPPVLELEPLLMS